MTINDAKTEYTADEAASILGIDTSTLLKHKTKLTMGKDWWYNEKREFRCTPEAIQILKDRPRRGKYERKKK